MPEYWAQACAALARRDAVLKRMMRVQGDARLSSRGDAFGTLARSIVGQQISVKAAESVWARLATGLGHKVRPQTVLACDVDALRQFG
ncbi:MAG: DNA-3-methyladenine glycosylase 2 family protein, partial [Betaproteobacteria bacterium]|nr:DNA-3-methyladenine glycosylase 2 family protein [Betaproteobacteria bacterium]